MILIEYIKYIKYGKYIKYRKYINKSLGKVAVAHRLW